MLFNQLVIEIKCHNAINVPYFTILYSNENEDIMSSRLSEGGDLEKWVQSRSITIDTALSVLVKKGAILSTERLKLIDHR